MRKNSFSANEIITAIFALERLIDSYITFSCSDSMSSRKRCWLIYQTCKERSDTTDIFSYAFDLCITDNGWLNFGNMFPDKFSAYERGLISDLPDNIIEKSDDGYDSDDDNSSDNSDSSFSSHATIFAPTATIEKTSIMSNYDYKNNG